MNEPEKNTQTPRSAGPGKAVAPRQAPTGTPRPAQAASTVGQRPTTKPAAGQPPRPAGARPTAAPTASAAQTTPNKQTAARPATGKQTTVRPGTAKTTATRPATGKQTTIRPVTGKATTIRPGTKKTTAIRTATTGKRPVASTAVLKRKKNRLRKNIGIFILLIAIFLLTGPFPADNTPWQNTAYGKHSLSTLASSEPSLAEGQLLAGIASEDITPEVGQPLMGYSDRKPLESTGTLSPCKVRALTLGTNKLAVTIVSVDALLVLDDLAEEVLRRTGLRSDDLFFTATHTHSGPGGWEKGRIVEFFYGKYNPRYFDKLASSITKAIQDSRSPSSLRPATLRFASANASDFVVNRIYGDVGGHSALSTVSALIVNEPGKEKPRAILTSFAAHATVIRREEHRASSDYPGEFCETLKKETGAEMVLFAAGAVGDARPSGSGEEYEKRIATGLMLALRPELKAAKEIEFNDILTWNIPVDIPPARLSSGVGPNWKLLPLLTPHVFPQLTRLSFLKLGNFALCGWPADVAGEVAAPLQAKAAKDGLTLLITSFNGSWRGYFTTPETYMAVNKYETRDVGFLGPQAGDFFSALTTRMFTRALKDTH